MVNAVDPDREAKDVEVEEAGPESPYRRVADGLRERIVSGELIPGQVLPALHEIAQAHASRCPPHTGLSRCSQRTDLWTLGGG